MSFLDSVVSGVITRPRKIGVYGEHGVGKTYWSVKKFPKPIVIAVEDGTSDLDCARIPTEVLTSSRAVMGAVDECSESDFQTIVVDSVDWFENLIAADLDKEGFDCSFGKGPVEVARRFGAFLGLLDKCTKAGKTVILIAHQEIRQATDINGNNWDQIRPKLSKRACELLMEWCDEVLLAKREDYVRKEDGAFGKKNTVATTTGRRILKTSTHPSYMAKARLDLPSEIDMNSDVSIFLTGAKE